MSDDFDADAMAKTLVKSFGFRLVHGFAVLELCDTVSIERQIAEALRDAESRGIERAAEVIKAARADYPEDVFPSLPAAAGIRFILDRLLGEIRHLGVPPD